MDKLVNDFVVNRPIEQTWAVLTDVERIAPCLPGAQLQEVEGDEYRGIVKVKVGPITAQYKGTATFLERDEKAHRAVLRIKSHDTGGSGHAKGGARETAVAAPFSRRERQVEDGHVRAGAPRAVTEEEVIHVGRILVDRRDQRTQAEDAHVEVA